MSKYKERPWLTIFLGVLCVAAIAVAYTTVGQASSATAQSRRTATVAQGVVQQTVSGSGTLKPAANVSVNFANSGTLTGGPGSGGDKVKPGRVRATTNQARA